MTPAARLAAQVEAAIEPILDRMMSAYRARIPTYATASPELLKDVRTGARQSIQAGLAMLRGEATAESLDEPLASVGRRRASQGVSLQDVLLAYQVGSQCFFEAAVEMASSAPAGERDEALIATTRVLLEVLQHATTAVSAAYLGVAQQVFADQEHEHNLIVAELAGVRQPDGHIGDRAARRGVEVGSVRWCVVVDSPASDTGTVARSIRRSLPTAAVGRIGELVVVYAPGDKPPELVEAPRGVAQHADPETAFRQARAAARAAAHLGEAGVLYDEAVPLAMLLDAPEQERAAFVQAQLGPVLDDPRRMELLDSLAAYYRAGQSAAAAARELHLHRHTLEYRLQRASALLGVDLRDPRHRLLIELALTLRG